MELTGDVGVEYVCCEGADGIIHDVGVPRVALSSVELGCPNSQRMDYEKVARSRIGVSYVVVMNQRYATSVRWSAAYWTCYSSGIL